jgi:hypothetical protein
MPLYFIKPIVWNDKDYKEPGGAKFTSGYPKENGFGHEEWNNSESMELSEKGQSIRIFHTEGLGNQPVDDFAGDIFIFMIASHGGHQYLVGVAGGATSLRSDRTERLRYVNRIKGVKNRWRDAWKLPSVNARFANDENAFRYKYGDELHWTPTWKCPTKLFHWLEKPLLLEPANIAGKTKLITMYNSYQEISRNIASYLLNCIPAANENSALENLKARCQSDEFDAATDIANVEADEKVSATTREALIQARIGQGKFRQDLIRIWKGGCAVTGCATHQVLRASHIMPWRDASNKQRLDPQNGLLLVANLDALFDRWLISFKDTGEMLISPKISKEQRRVLGLPAKLKGKPTVGLCHYLEHHRKKFDAEK